MARFNISQRNGWFWAQHSVGPEFCRSRAERVREKDHSLAICYSAAREKWVGGGNSDEFLREKFPGCKTTAGVHQSPNSLINEKGSAPRVKESWPTFSSLFGGGDLRFESCGECTLLLHLGVQRERPRGWGIWRLSERAGQAACISIYPQILVPTAKLAPLNPR